jgi:acyl phosphate:glycerol-3-phosphate acyltransferase
MPLLWLLISFLFGALPLALWIGRLAGKDIRQVGDGNPGATNVLRAAGWPWFIWAICAEFSKGAIPVGIAYQLWGWRDWWMVPIALAPGLGHAFSPFLGGRGGKALAALLGSWIGLTLWRVPAVMLISLTLFFFLLRPLRQKNELWAILPTLATACAYLLLFQPDPLLLAILATHLALILWTHRR